MNEETMVENIDNEQADDTLEENVVEEEQDESESLDSLTDDGKGDGEAPDDEPEQPAQQSATEPGWIKKRVEKAVSRAVAETEARMQAMFDQQMAPIRARMMEDEAQELVRSRKVSDIETARELVRLRNGQSAAPTVSSPSAGNDAQPRQANGQFASKSDPATEKQIAMLKHQANKIHAAGGPDVLAEFRENEEIKQKVIKGEMDFYDVRDYMNSQKTSKKRAPSPMRSPNGASGKNPNAIDTMSDEQFDRMEKRIKEGARYTLK